MTNLLTRVMVVAGLLACAMFIQACGPGRARLGRYNLVVTPDPSLRDAGGRLPQVEVDLVGVKEDDAMNWAGYSVDRYFSGEDKMRSGASGYTRTMIFNADSAGPQTVSANDPIWQVWQERGVTQLFVFASSRSLRPSPGGPELRRKSIPLTTDKWETGTSQIDVVVRASGVDSPTPMKVLKK
jgi:hypothetical protein